MRTNEPGLISQTDRNSRMVLISSARKIRKIEVKLVCEKCSKHVEKVAKSVVGVKDVKWSGNSNQLILTFDPHKTSLEAIEKTIAEAGHDTPHFKKKMEYYNDAPKCCKFSETLTDTGE